MRIIIGTFMERPCPRHVEVVCYHRTGGPLLENRDWSLVVIACFGVLIITMILLPAVMYGIAPILKIGEDGKRTSTEDPASDSGSNNTDNVSSVPHVHEQ